VAPVRSLPGDDVLTRSFDNLLGYLYEPGEVASFEGVLGKDLSNPIPDYASGTERGVVPVHVASSTTRRRVS
jgi:phospholipase C